MKPRRGPGRTLSYRAVPSLLLPEEVEIPTCGRCRATYIDEQTAGTLAPLLEKEYRRQLSERGQQALTILSAVVSQRALEHLIDLSQGYLSRIRAGHGTPSAQLVLLLALLAHEPDLLGWAEQFWADPNQQDGKVPSQSGAPKVTTASRGSAER